MAPILAGGVAQATGDHAGEGYHGHVFERKEVGRSR